MGSEKAHITDFAIRGSDVWLAIVLGSASAADGEVKVVHFEVMGWGTGRVDQRVV